MLAVKWKKAGPECDVDFKDRLTWPKIVPDWAKRKQLKDKVCSPSELVDEYLFGWPSAPSVRDLEHMYGPVQKKGKMGKSWRTRENPKEQNKMRKSFCCRNVGYQEIEKIIDDELSLEENRTIALEKLEHMMVHHGIVESIEDARKPGSAAMNRFLVVLRELKVGSEERSEEGRKRALKKRVTIAQRKKGNTTQEDQQ